jgi:hypothetical protein
MDCHFSVVPLNRLQTSNHSSSEKKMPEEASQVRSGRAVVDVSRLRESTKLLENEKLETEVKGMMCGTISCGIFMSLVTGAIFVTEIFMTVFSDKAALSSCACEGITPYVWLLVDGSVSVFSILTAVFSIVYFSCTSSKQDIIKRYARKHGDNNNNVVKHEDEDDCMTCWAYVSATFATISMLFLIAWIILGGVLFLGDSCQSVTIPHGIYVLFLIIFVVKMVAVGLAIFVPACMDRFNIRIRNEDW